MKQIILSFILVASVFTLSALADVSAVKQQMQGDIGYVSGGVGIDEKNAMEALRRDYNLHLIFAEGKGTYVSHVKVNIIDSDGHIILDTLADGPMLYVALKPGRYKVSAEVDGQVLERKATIGKTKAAALNFLWPSLD
jgi:hypothetical protein